MEFFLQKYTLDRQSLSRFSVSGKKKNNLSIVPAEAVDKEPDGEGPEHSAHGENGYRERPQRGESGLRDGLGVPVGPRLIVEALNDLLKHSRYGVLEVVTC